MSCAWLLIASFLIPATGVYSSFGDEKTKLEAKPLSAELAEKYKLDSGFYKKCALVHDILMACRRSFMATIISMPDKNWMASCISSFHNRAIPASIARKTPRSMAISAGISCRHPDTFALRCRWKRRLWFTCVPTFPRTKPLVGATAKSPSAIRFSPRNNDVIGGVFTSN